MRTEPIKIFVDGHVFDGEYQGTRTFIQELYSSLSQKEGIAIYIGAYDIANLEKHFPVAASIRFIKYRSRSGFIRLLYDIPSIIKRYGIQYAHFQYITPLVKNCKFIVTTHDVLFNEYPKEFSWWYRLKKNFLYKISARKADILTTDSEYSSISIQKYLDIRPPRINVFSLGINDRYFEAYDKAAAKQLIQQKYGFDEFILFVSRLEPRKNHALLLQAWLDLQLYKKRIQLVIIGHQTIKIPGFDALMKNLPKEARPFVFISDAIDDDELMTFYRAARLFVYPSKAEGFGIPPLEAGALKIPVLCSNNTAMSEFSFFGENHIDPADHEHFRNRLSAMISNAHDPHSVDAIARTIRERYCWKKPAEDLYRLIETDHF